MKGIPFAVPPLGDRRWESPQAMRRSEGTCWKGIYQAIKFGNQCPQLDPGSKQYTGDCNTLFFISAHEVSNFEFSNLLSNCLTLRTK